MTQPRQRLENSTNKKKKGSAPVGRPRIYLDPLPQKPRLYIELDNVINDLDKAIDFSGLSQDEFKLQAGVYLNVPPRKGAIKSLEKLRDSGSDIWITTRVHKDNQGAASEKIHWIKQYVPWLMRKVIIVPEKGTLGHHYDYMVHSSECDNFLGKTVAFGRNKAMSDWETLLAYLTDTLHLDISTDLRNGSTMPSPD